MKINKDPRLPEYQGRTQKQQDSNEAVGAASVMILIVGIIIASIWNLILWLIS